jgi:hypothetical protein
MQAALESGGLSVWCDVDQVSSGSDLYPPPDNQYPRALPKNVLHCASHAFGTPVPFPLAKVRVCRARHPLVKGTRPQTESETPAPSRPVPPCLKPTHSASSCAAVIGQRRRSYPSDGRQASVPAGRAACNVRELRR